MAKFRGKRDAEWWPSSAKLVLEKNYKCGIHAHDVGQVMDELKSFLVSCNLFHGE